MTLEAREIARHDVVPEDLARGLLPPEVTAKFARPLLIDYKRMILSDDAYHEAAMKQMHYSTNKVIRGLVPAHTISYLHNGSVFEVTYRPSGIDRNEYLKLRKRPQDNLKLFTDHVINVWTVWGDTGSERHGYVGHFQRTPKGMKEYSVVDSIFMNRRTIEEYNTPSTE